MAANNPLQNTESNYSPALAELLKPFFHQAKYPVAIIYGNPDTGKTDTACLLAEIGIKEGWIDYFAANFDTGGVGQKITSLADVKWWHRNQVGRKLYLLDEAGIHESNRNPLSRLNKEIRNEIFIARKFKVKWIFMLQELKDIDNWKDSSLTGLIIKKNTIGGVNGTKEFTALVKWKNDPDLTPVYKFPRTIIPYNTLDTAPFTLERSDTTPNPQLRGIPNRVAELYAQGQNFSVIATILSKETGEKWRNQEVIRELKKYLKQTLRFQENNQSTDVVQHNEQSGGTPIPFL